MELYQRREKLYYLFHPISPIYIFDLPLASHNDVNSSHKEQPPLNCLSPFHQLCGFFTWEVCLSNHNENRINITLWFREKHLPGSVIFVETFEKALCSKKLHHGYETMLYVHTITLFSSLYWTSLLHQSTM